MSYKKLTFLVIDDARLIREILKEMIEVNLGHKVIGIGKSGQDAITMYRNLNPDIVTMDIAMPGIDGNQALKAIKEINENAKVVMMTSKGQSDIVRTSIKLKADAYILKPPSPQKLYDVVEKLFPNFEENFVEKDEEYIDKFYEFGDD